MPIEKRILCVFAHPDDECYGPGGTIAKYAREGADVFILMFTNGEAGSIGISKELDASELSRRRKIELADSCKALGVCEYRMLGVPDKGVSASSQDTAVAEIISDIDRYEPQVLVTFHHRGVSGHTDHIAVAEFLHQGFISVSGYQPTKLYEWGQTEAVTALYERPAAKPIFENEIDAIIEIDDDAMTRKMQAIRAHATQYDFFERMNAKFDYPNAVRPEHFHLRATRLNRPDGVETDLFAGITK